MSAFDIKQFYTHSRGRMILRHIRPIIKSWWPDLNGLNVLGCGYPQHYLSPYKTSKHDSLTILMNQTYDPKPWPKKGDNKLAVYEDDKIPLGTQTMDRILAVHALETSDTPRKLLAELWRVLEGSGRLILIVPNRGGLWSRAENTPFVQGSSYSLTQLTHQLNEAGFSVEQYEKALYMPSGRSRMLISTAPLWEKMGKRFCPALGGVIVIEASKQLFSPNGLRVTGTKRNALNVSTPATVVNRS